MFSLRNLLNTPIGRVLSFMFVSWLELRNMGDILKLTSFVRPYWKRSLATLVLLAGLVFMDLSIPRLIQRIIDQRIKQQNQFIVIHTVLLMLGISALSTIFALGNNMLSVQVGEGVACDLREALFLRIRAFSYCDLDQQKTGQLMVRLASETIALQVLADEFRNH